MLLLKISVTLIAVLIICLLWDLVFCLIYNVTQERKSGIYYSGRIKAIIIIALVILGVTLLITMV